MFSPDSSDRYMDPLPEDASEKPSVAIGLLSLITALAALTMLIYFVNHSHISIQTDTVVLVTDSSESVAYIAIVLLLVGLSIGVAGYLRPSSLKLIAIVGAVFNASLLVAVAGAVGLFYYWRSLF